MYLYGSSIRSLFGAERTACRKSLKRVTYIGYEDGLMQRHEHRDGKNLLNISCYSLNPVKQIVKLGCL